MGHESGKCQVVQAQVGLPCTIIVNHQEIIRQTHLRQHPNILEQEWGASSDSSPFFLKHPCARVEQVAPAARLSKLSLVRHTWTSVGLNKTILQILTIIKMEHLPISI